MKDRAEINGLSVIYQPTIRLVAATQVCELEIEKAVWEWCQDDGPLQFDPKTRQIDAQLLMELGGRTCYQSFAKGRNHQDHIRNLVKCGHLSTMEHASFSFLVSGVSRSLLCEMTRHRHLSFSVMSQRYVDHRKHKIGFVVPVKILGNDHNSPQFKEWLTGCAQAMGQYRLLVDSLGQNEDGTTNRKAIAEAARSVLPNSTETRFLVSGNARAWWDFLGRRTTGEAEPEIRRLAFGILDFLEEEMPDVFGHFFAKVRPA